ncbi:PQQ-binding-like beta-propeller repeat protein [Novipirellula sp.]|uniref:outer membrane protein assembly factor BamB family protein n=1 Tax=Novipirellula sp. TaxID=2795430 RepID=UPI003561F7AC
MIRITVSWIFLCCFAFHTTAAEPSWTQWLGDGRDGVSEESGWSIDWPESGLPIAWEREIGIGFSSVSIANGRLFTMGHNDGEETVYCLNQTNGETIWSHSYPSALVDNLYEGGPGATPTIDGDHVYTLGKEGQLFCLSAEDGTVLWQRELQKDLDVELPEWGFNSSPTLVNNQVIVQGGRVASYNKTNGELIWKTPKHTAGYGCAEVFQHDGNTMLATLDSDGLRILDASNGKQIDAFPWPSPFRTNSTTPIVQDDTIYISTGYGVGCGKFRLTDGKLELIYDNREMRNHFNNSILYQGNLYGFDGNSNLGRVVQLICMDHETGDVLWQQRGLGCGSLMIADGKLVLLSEDGQLVIAEATGKEYTELARAEILDGRCWTVPVLLDGHVYARNARGRLVAVTLP